MSTPWIPSVSICFESMQILNSILLQLVCTGIRKIKEEDLLFYFFYILDIYGGLLEGYFQNYHFFAVEFSI
jgi:hypothetical protein